MLQLNCQYGFTGVPLVTNEALDDYAVAILKKMMPEDLMNPAAIDIEKLAEYKLHLSVEYKRLSRDETILGLTAFSDGFIEVCDDDFGRVKPLYIERGTILVDSRLMEKTYRMRFTLAHEVSHWLIHQKAFSAIDFTIAAKEGNADYSRSQKERKDSDKLERQADFLASCLLMPKPTLHMAITDFFAYYGEKPQRIKKHSCAMHSLYAQLLPQYIANIFQVSQQAAKIRLEKLGIIYS